MLLATLKDPYYCYFTFAEELREYFGETTTRLEPKNHERRAASRLIREGAEARRDA